MEKKFRIFAVASLLVLMVSPTFAEKSKGIDGKKSNKAAGPKDISADCAPPTSSIELSLNNVKATIHSGGDMWWDLLNTPRYEVPKGSGKHSLYAGSLWMGGTDVNGQLKVAAVRFRQVGYDYWPGPLNTVTAEISPEICVAYDKFFKITRTEVDKFVAWYLCKEDPNCDVNVDHQGYTVPASILDWPAHGDVSLGHDYNLAPYFDADGSGSYNPTEGGDYPYYDLNPTDFDCLQERAVKLFGDETHWWVFNDKGNIHTESGGNPIGMEIRGQAFAFATNDEINDMTFYNYELINRGTFTLQNTYFAQWVDPDLGFAQDDYVGCDVQRGLGYCYNGLAVDGTGGPTQYGANPPAVGVDFFQGPYQDNDGADNPLYSNCEVTQAISEGGIVYKGMGVGYGDGIVDNERFGMRKFIFHNNNNGDTGDPVTAAEYYNYMRGIWKDNNPLCFGGNGNPTGGCNGTPAGYMFPGDSDPCHWGTEGLTQPLWTEQTADNQPFDRRFMQSAGPFTLLPGAVNDLTVGVVWARATNASDPFASVEKLRVIDDKAQALFDNCFVLIDGPDAPEMEIVELDRELVLLLSNPVTSNNAGEDYAQVDPFIVGDPSWDITYRFQGYQIFQLKDNTVSSSELQNSDVARLVAQCDIKDIDPLTNAPISQLVNFTFSEELNASVPMEMVNGANNGIQHSFRVTQDLFATSDRRLVNHKKYYYMAVAYAHNNYKTYDQNNALALDGQKKPYLAGRKNAFGSAIASELGIPHKLAPEQQGTVVNANYGDGPRLTRVEGQGNGGRDLKYTSETLLSLANSADGRSVEVTYDFGRGPVDIKVVDPKRVPIADFVFKILDTITPGNLSDATWSLQCLACPTNPQGADVTVLSDRTLTLRNGNEQLIQEWGLSVKVEQTINPGDVATGMGFIDSRLNYSGTSFWLSGVSDADGVSAQNWIRSGTVQIPTAPAPNLEDHDYGDPDQVFEKVLGGTWAPWKLTSHKDGVQSPSWKQFKGLNDLKNLAGVDVIFTSNKDLWTKCAVLEVSDDDVPSIGGARRFDLRQNLSVNKQGQPDGSGSKGMGWFPGYAVNVETGERLNMAFGESSWLIQEGGADMVWNPNSKVFDAMDNVVFGGGHYIYVFGHNGNNVANDVPAYDEGEFIFQKLSSNNYLPTDAEKRKVYKDAMWVGVPLLANNSRLLANDVTVELRVTKPYNSNLAPGWFVDQPVNNNLPMYTFSTADFATVRGDLTAAESALDLIRAVPNPYYAHSDYERTQLDNIVKIINLPDVCTVSIYTVNGILVRQYKKDSPITSLDWNLQNHKGIPVASGVYLIHVNAPGIGEKVVKWFGTIRQLDLDSF